MTELKTLKDLLEPTGDYTGHWFVVDPDKLKAEAVKWVRSMRAEALVSGIPYKELGDRDAVLKFIDFFNLTEENLK